MTPADEHLPALNTAEVSTLAELLRDAEHHHGPYEATAPKHHWSDWYAGYMVAREHGLTVEEAERAAARHTEAVVGRVN